MRNIGFFNLFCIYFEGYKVYDNYDDYYNYNYDKVA